MTMENPWFYLVNQWTIGANWKVLWYHPNGSERERSVFFRGYRYTLRDQDRQRGCSVGYHTTWSAGSNQRNGLYNRTLHVTKSNKYASLKITPHMRTTRYNHLSSSLRPRAQRHDEKGLIYMGFQVWSLRCAAGLVWGGVHSLVVCVRCGGISFGWGRSEVGMVGLRVSMAPISTV